MIPEELHQRLRRSGFRITKARRAILDLLFDQHCALSVQDLGDLLKKRRVKADVSTLYRELQFLSGQGIAREVLLQDGVKRYELSDADHHHHLVCDTCKGIEVVDMEKDLDAVERQVQKERNFTVRAHSLEFYGKCANCQ